MTAPPDQERVRSRSWEGGGVGLGAVIEHLARLERELTEHDRSPEEHPHPRNCVLNLIVVVADRHRAGGCDRTIANLGAGHPLRAILVHPGGTEREGTLDAEVTVDAHQLVSGFPVQRSQVLLHVHGEAVRHLASLIGPLLVPDVPTYFWWSGRGHLDRHAIGEATFADVVVVDSERVQRPVDALREMSAFAAGADTSAGVADFRWERLRPWRDAIAQFFGPAARRDLLHGLDDVAIDAAGTGRAGRAGAALLVGWAAAMLGREPIVVERPGEDATEGVAGAAGRRVRLALRSVPREGVPDGSLLAVRLRGRSGHRDWRFDVELERSGRQHAAVTIELGGRPPLRQRLELPRLDDSDLLTHVLLTSRPGAVLARALASAAPLLEALR